MLSHDVLQQNGSAPQIFVTQPAPSQPFVSFTPIRHAL
jgi:hypothetical protein